MRRGGLLSREHVEEAVCGYGGEGKEGRKEGRKGKSAKKRNNCDLGRKERRKEGRKKQTNV